PVGLLAAGVAKDLADYLVDALKAPLASIKVFQYRTTFLEDERPAQQRVADAGLTDSERLRTRRIAESHRRVIGAVPTLGEALVRRVGDAQEIVHRMHWDIAGHDPKDGQKIMFTEHHAPLARPKDAEKPLPGVGR